MPGRTYTVEEANRCLPEVRDAVGRIAQLSEYLPELEDQVRIAQYRRGRPGAGARETGEHKAAAEKLEAAQLELLTALRTLDELDVQLKDARTGLVDFLAYREGEVVELCWRLGEAAVAHWHRIGEGFPGRKPL